MKRRFKKPKFTKLKELKERKPIPKVEPPLKRLLEEYDESLVDLNRDS